jgi:hypothetical protein
MVCSNYALSYSTLDKGNLSPPAHNFHCIATYGDWMQLEMSDFMKYKVSQIEIGAPWTGGMTE